MSWKIIEKLDFMTPFLKADGEAGHLALSPTGTKGINYTKNFQYRMVEAIGMSFFKVMKIEVMKIGVPSFRSSFTGKKDKVTSSITFNLSEKGIDKRG